MRKILLFALILLMGCGIQSCISDNNPVGPSLSVGDSLPVFSIVMNDGAIVSSQSLMGKVPVIVFFNTGCPDCQKELPVIQQLWQIYEKSAIVKIIPISREESQEAIEEYWNNNGFTMPYSPQENREVYSLFATSIIPRIYIADPYGKIIASFDENLPSFETLKAQIEKADPTEKPLNP